MVNTGLCDIKGRCKGHSELPGGILNNRERKWFSWWDRWVGLGRGGLKGFFTEFRDNFASGVCGIKFTSCKLIFLKGICVSGLSKKN